jgi:hypothetical protein
MVFLEGTGSFLDRANEKHIALCLLALMRRLFIEFCEDFDYAPVLFEAFHTVNGERKLISH